MPSLLSGSTLRKGGSNTFIQLSGAQPQLPANADTSTGYTVVTDEKLVTTYRSSLGNIEFYKGEAYSNLPDGKITLAGTGTGFIVVKNYVESTSTVTGSLVVEGGVGIGGGMWVQKDIHVNGLTIGQGFQGYNNIVVTGAPALTPPDDLLTGQQSINIGWGSLRNIQTTNGVIAIGRNALSTGTGIRGTIAIGDRALEMSGTTPPWLVKPISTVTNTNPVVVETGIEHEYTTGTAVVFEDINGTVELNDNKYWVIPLTTNTFALYTDVNVTVPLDGTTYSAYISSGTVTRYLLRNNNVAIGQNAGRSLQDGQRNFFMGDNIAINLITGTSNFYLGHEVSNNMYKGSYNIGIMSNSLVDGLDNQIGIGSIFYYNGQQFLRLETDASIGIGTTSTNSNSGALVVEGGLGVNFDGHFGGNVYANNFIGLSTTATNIDGGAAGSIPYQTGTGLTALLPIGPANYYLRSTGTAIEWAEVDSTTSNVTDFANTANIALTVVVQAAEESVLYPTFVNVYNTNTQLYSTSTIYFDSITERLNAFSLDLFSDTESTSTTSGALTVVGGAGIQGDLYVGGTIYGNVLATDASMLRTESNAIDGNYYLTFVDSNNSTATSENFYTTSSIIVNPGKGLISIGAPPASWDPSANALEIGAQNSLWVESDKSYLGNNVYWDGFNTRFINNGYASLYTADKSTGKQSWSSTLLGTGTELATFSEILTITPDGLVGISQSIPDSKLHVNGTVKITGQTRITDATPSTATNNGAVVIDGGLGVVGDIYTNNLRVTSYAGSTSTTEGAAVVLGDLGVDGVVNTDKAVVFNTLASTSTTTGALTVAGGVGVKGSIHSAEGGEYHNYLLYTPRVTVSPTPPNTATNRVGDFWVDSGSAVTLQWIQDGTSTFWLQISSI